MARLATSFIPLDVRDLVENGIEPSREIRSQANSLSPTQGLAVIAPFLPSPLIESLGYEGFHAKIERGSGSDWVVYLWR